MDSNPHTAVMMSAGRDQGRRLADGALPMRWSQLRSACCTESSIPVRPGRGLHSGQGGRCADPVTGAEVPVKARKAYNCRQRRQCKDLHATNGGIGHRRHGIVLGARQRLPEVRRSVGAR